MLMQNTETVKMLCSSDKDKTVTCLPIFECQQNKKWQEKLL